MVHFVYVILENVLIIINQDILSLNSLNSL